MFSKKATKINEIFTVDLTLCSKCQIDGEYFVAFLENSNFKDNFSLWKEHKIVAPQTCFCYVY